MYRNNVHEMIETAGTAKTRLEEEFQLEKCTIPSSGSIEHAGTRKAFTSFHLRTSQILR